MAYVWIIEIKDYLRDGWAHYGTYTTRAAARKFCNLLNEASQFEFRIKKYVRVE